MKKELEIYVHIPFCAHKCAYCDFLSAVCSRESQKQYLRALRHEILSFLEPQNYQVSSVFFGGGTPSILPAEELLEILALLRSRFVFSEKPEITIECNPGTADWDKLRAYHDGGINRISFGLQSASDEELKCLGRIHNWADFCHIFQNAREVGFQNINVDLMSALPGQSVQSWENTLQKVLALQPEHISAYSLIIEEGTPFFEKYEKDALVREQGGEPEFLPSEDAEREMYLRTEKLLSTAGLHRYEISNYAKPGFSCRHNIGYWIGKEYVGFGLGAASYLNHVRYSNTDSMQEYLDCCDNGKSVVCERQELSSQEEMAECMILGLRMTEGISEQRFLERFGIFVDDMYHDVIQKWVQLGLLHRENGRIALTGKGLDLSNQVMADFII